MTVKQSIIEALRTDFFLIGDGHTIYDPSYYAKLPPAFVADFIRVHRSNQSDPTGKGIITRADDTQGDVSGVYNLSILRGIARAIGADTRNSGSKMGRGSEALALVEEIRAVVFPDA